MLKKEDILRYYDAYRAIEDAIRESEGMTKDEKSYAISRLRQTATENVHHFENLYPDFLNNREILLARARTTPHSLTEIDFHEFKDDRELAAEIAKTNGDDIRFFSDAIRADRDIVKAAIQSCSDSFRILKCTPAFKDDDEIVKIAAMKNGFNIRDASDRLYNDREMMLIAVRSHGGALINHPSKAIREDPEICLTAIGNMQGLQLLFKEGISPKLRKNKAFMMKAIDVSPYAYEYGYSSVKKDPEVVDFAIEKGLSHYRLQPEIKAEYEARKKENQKKRNFTEVEL